MGKASKVTVGFKYYLSMHMGICRGPVDALLEIKVGDRRAWRGELTSNQSFNIDAENLFGGTKGEGGIKGTAELYMGEANQTISAKLKKILPGLAPAFRGLVTLYYDGMVSAMNPYPKPWEFKVRRLRKGWDGPVWYPEKIQINLEDDYVDSDGKTQHGAIQAMNGVHIIYQACTDRVWGRGIPASLMDDAAWRYAADLIYNEGLGICLAWKRTDNLDQFVQSIIDHLGATIFVDKRNGLMTIKIIRDDYVREDLPVFTTDSGLVNITECSISAGTGLLNEIVVAFHSPLSNEDGKMRAHNLAGIQTAGSIVSSSVDYPGIPTKALAQRLADRDLNAQSIPLRGFKLTLDHRGWAIQPGSIFRIQDPKRGGIDIAVRAGEVREDPITGGQIEVAGIEDVFAMPVNGTAAVQPPQTNPPDRLPSIARRRAYEVPYALLNRMFPEGEFAAIKPQYGYYGMAAEKPTPISMGYDLAMKADGETAFDVRGQGGFNPLGELTAPVGYLDTVIRIEKTKDMEFADVGDCIMIDEEILRVDAIEEELNDTYKLTVGRGVYDTIPFQHFAGVLAWFFEEDVGSDSLAYVGGETVNGKVLPYTFAGRVKEEDAPIDTVLMNFRFIRPYAPGYVFMNGNLRWFATTAQLNKNTPVLAFSWNHRDRVAQEDTRIDHEVGDIGPEPGTAYLMRFYNEEGIMVREETGINGKGYEYLWAQAMNDLGVTEQDDGREFPMVARLWSRRIGYESWQYYTMRFVVQDIATFLQMKMMAQQSSQTVSPDNGGEDDSTETQGLMMAMLAEQSGQEASPDADDIPSDGVSIAQLSESAGQLTLMPVRMDSQVFEAPYLELFRKNLSLSNSRPMAVAARPSDRLTDSFGFYSSRLTAVTVGDKTTYTEDGYRNSGSGEFTPWATTSALIDYLDTEIQYSSSSDEDGVPLSSVNIGDLALIDSEIIRIDGIGNGTLIIGRGVADTVPAMHGKNAPIWFFQRRNGMSSFAYAGEDRVRVKLKPDTFSVPYELTDISGVDLQLKKRPVRPYPPGNVLVDGKRWWVPVTTFSTDSNGVVTGRPVVFQWKDRDRLSQAGDAIDHLVDNIGPEPGTKYRLWVGYTKANSSGGATKTTLREYDIEGRGFTYTPEMAAADGQIAGRAFQACGSVTIQATLFSVKDDLMSWQGYSFFLIVPSYACPVGQKPGGGNKPPTTTPPPVTTDPSNPPDPSEPPKEPDPIDPTTPDPTEPVDPDWPPEEPPVIIDPPQPPDPDFAGNWSYDWDHGWANTLPKTL